MPLCGYAMMRMSFWWCAMMRVSHWCMLWCECPIGACYGANALLVMQWTRMPVWVCNECKFLFGSMPWCRMLWCKHNLFKNSFYFQNEASTTLETKIFSKTWFIIHEKSSSFWLKVPKKLVITIRKSLNGVFTWNLMIWFKRLIFTISSSKEMARFQGLFWKRWIL